MATRPMQALSILVLVGLALAMVLPAPAALRAEAEDAGVGGAEVEASAATLQAKAVALKVMLERCLALNLSERVRASIEALLAVNVTALPAQQLRGWVQNASRVMAMVASEVRAGRAYAVGQALERYLNGLRVAVQNRLRAIARFYNVSAEELLANVTGARDLNQLLKALRWAARELEARRALAFAERVRAVVIANATAAMERGLARALEAAGRGLERATLALRKALDRLRALNASEEAQEALVRALENVGAAKELVTQVLRGLAGQAAPEAVREAALRQVEALRERVSQAVEEALEELEVLAAKASTINASEVLARVDELRARLSEVRDRLLELGVPANASEALANLRALLNEVAEIKLLSRRLENLVSRLTLLAEEAGARAEEQAREAIAQAEEELHGVAELLSEVKERVANVVCIAVYPPPPPCRVYQEVARGLAVIEERVREAEALLNKAKEAYGARRYGAALEAATKASGILRAARAWLERALERLAAATPSEVQPPALPIPPAKEVPRR